MLCFPYLSDETFMLESLGFMLLSGSASSLDRAATALERRVLGGKCPKNALNSDSYFIVVYYHRLWFSFSRNHWCQPGGAKTCRLLQEMWKQFVGATGADCHGTGPSARWETCLGWPKGLEVLAELSQYPLVDYPYGNSPFLIIFTYTYRTMENRHV